MTLKKLITTTITAVTLLCATAFSVSAKTDIVKYRITNATDIQKHLAGLIELSEDKQKEYDFNGDEILNIIDSTVLQYSLAETETPTVEPTTQPTTVAPTVETTVPPTTKPCPSTIKLDISSITLGAGETYTLKRTTDISDYPFVFTSSNSKVATVDSNGKITAKSSGTATIKCSAENGISASCNVTVKNAPTSVSLSVTSKELKVGQDFIISESTNNGSYSYRFTWSSSNTEVATVTKTTGSQAKIQPKKQGTANITIKTYNGKTATCKVTIKD